MTRSDREWDELLPAPRPARWPWALLGLVLVAVMLVFGVLLAHAHDHKRPDLDQWYRGLGSARSPCCTGEEEGSKLVDSDWRMDHLEDCKVTNGEVYGQNAIGTQYCVKMYNVWWLVPDNAIVKGQPNLVGVAIVWPLISYGKGDEKLVNIRCFLPSPVY